MLWIIWLTFAVLNIAFAMLDPGVSYARAIEVTYFQGSALLAVWIAQRVDRGFA